MNEICVLNEVETHILHFCGHVEFQSESRALCNHSSNGECLTLVLLQGANLQGVKMLCSNAEGASLKGCNFEDPSGLKANLEGTHVFVCF